MSAGRTIRARITMRRVVSLFIFLSTLLFSRECKSQEWTKKQVADLSKKIHPFYKNGAVTGYYFLYKNLAEQPRYHLQILDENLQATGNLDLPSNREAVITGGDIKDSCILLELTFYDKDSWSDLLVSVPSRTVQRLLVDRAANILYSDSTQLKTISELKRYGLTAANPFHVSRTFSIDNVGGGFVFPAIRKNNSFEYSLQFFPGGSHKYWQYKSPQNVSDRNPVFFAGDSSLIWSFFERITGSKKEQIPFLRAHQTSSGESVLELPLFVNGKRVLPLKASILDEKIKVLGLYYDGRYEHNMQSASGLCSVTINKQGKFTDSAMLNWKELAKDNAFPRKGSFLIREIVETAGNHYVLLLEHSRQAVDGGALFFNALMAAVGASLGTSFEPTDIFETVYDDLILVECSAELAPLHIEIVQQPQNTGAQFLEVSSVDTNSTMTISFIDRATVTGSDSHIRFNDLQYSAQAVKMQSTSLQSDIRAATYYVAKKGYVLQAVYDIKTNNQTLRLIAVKY